MKPLMIDVAVLFFFLAFSAFAELDIDYRHSISGEGTVVTDYLMSTPQNSEASGKVRGSGELMNKYIFQSANGSQNFTLRDEFIFSRLKPEESPLAKFPRRPESPSWFRLAGSSWAGNIKALVYKDYKQKIPLPVDVSVSAEKLTDLIVAGPSQVNSS